MIAIIFSACFALAPYNCKTVTQTFADDGTGVTPYSCLMYGQLGMAQWKRDNPNWNLGRMRGCAKAGQFAKA